MDPRRLSAGEWIAATGAVVLLVSLFLEWYEPGVSGWEAFAVTDIVLAAAALLAIVAWGAGAGDRTYPTAIAWLSLTMLLALAAVVAAAYRTLDPPGDAERALGAWLGAAAVLALIAGTFRAMRDEGRARRSPDTERRAAAEALARAELLTLPGDSPAGPRAG